MSLFTRMVRLCKADLHGVMDQFEDRQLLMNQYLREMQAAMVQTEQRLKQSRQRRQQIAQDLDRCRQEIDHLEADLDLAIKNDKDDIARMLIRKRHPLNCQQRSLQDHLAEMDRAQVVLGETLADQQARFRTIRAKSAALAAQQCREADTGEAFGANTGIESPSDEEVEWQLLQRKEALTGKAHHGKNA